MAAARLLLAAAALARPLMTELPLTPGRAVMPAASEPLLSTVLVDVCVALTRSTICTFSVSPTMRAR